MKTRTVKVNVALTEREADKLYEIGDAAMMLVDQIMPSGAPLALRSALQKLHEAIFDAENEKHPR